MANSLNKVILMGNLTADPELRTTNTGLAVCNFSLAVNRKYAKQGDQAVDYINISCWRASAEFVGKYAKKGNSLVVCGSLQTRTWVDNSGQKRYVTEVLADEVSFAGNNKSEGGYQQKSANTGGNSYVPSSYGGNSAGFEPIEIENNDLPF